jgi:hypothetical protein
LSKADFSSCTLVGSSRKGKKGGKKFLFPPFFLTSEELTKHVLTAIDAGAEFQV